MSDFQNLTLVLATRAQILASRKQHAAEWSDGVPLEEYLELYEKIEQHERATDGRLLTWVLVRRDDPESLDYFCTCATTRQDSLLRSVRNASVEVKSVCGYAIATVYTPEAHRKKGYSKHMMQLLHWVLAPESALPSSSFPKDRWGAPPDRIVGDAVFSVLYSVGWLTEFYAKCGPFPTHSETTGWIPTTVKTKTWEVEKLVADVDDHSSKWALLAGQELSQVLELDAELIKEEMTRPASPIDDTREVAFLPIHGLVQFQYEWFPLSWSHLQPKPTHWGICLSSPGKNGKLSLNVQTMATWTIETGHGLASPMLVITRLRSTPGNFEALLKQIAIYAKRHGAGKIEIWNLPEGLLEIGERLGGVSNIRVAGKGRRSSFKWYGEGVGNWIHNEAFCCTYGSL